MSCETGLTTNVLDLKPLLSRILQKFPKTEDFPHFLIKDDKNTVLVGETDACFCKNLGLLSCPWPLNLETRVVNENKVLCEQCKIGLWHVSSPLVINDTPVAAITIPCIRGPKTSFSDIWNKICNRLKPNIKDDASKIFNRYIPKNEADLKKLETRLEMVSKYISVSTEKEIISIIRNIVNDVLIQIVSGSDKDKILKTVQEKSCAVTNAERGCLLLLDQKTGKLIREIPCDDHKVNKKTCKASSKNKKGVIYWVFKNKEPILIPDVEEEKRWEFREGVGSELNVPLICQGDATGVIHVSSSQKKAFTPYHQEVLSTLATEAAIAIGNSQSYEKYVQQLKDLASLSKISEAINSKDKLTDILHTILSAASKRIGKGKNMGILLLGVCRT